MTVSGWLVREDGRVSAAGFIAEVFAQPATTQGAVRARELAQALVDLVDENTNIKAVRAVAAVYRRTTLILATKRS
jgi:hypothetical protein